jgi:hypothetical protein
LSSAFIALVASSLDYALVAGEVAGTQRVASLQAIAGMGFSIAGVMLVYSILLLFSDLRHHTGVAAINLLRNLTVLFLPPLLVLLMWGGLRDHLSQKYGPDGGFVLADWFSVITLVTTVITVVGLRLTSGRRSQNSARTHPTALSTAAAQLAFLSLIGSAGLITVTTADTVIADAIPVAAMLLVAGFSIATAYAASRHPSLPTERAKGLATGYTGDVVEAQSSGANDTSSPANGGAAVLEPLNRPTLVRRSVAIFPQAYLMNISIIQGVALSVMTVETVNFLKRADSTMFLPTLAQAVLSLTALIIVSYEYLWFTTIMRWTPTFRDTAIPVVLGVGEIIPALLLGRTFAWWIAIAVFAMLGAMAFFNTVTRLQPTMFPGHPASYSLIRRLLCHLTMICVMTACSAVAIAFFINRYPDRTEEFSTAGASLITLVSIVAVIGRSENVLNKVYAHYQIGRRPPIFDRIRRVLHTEQSQPHGATPTTPDLEAHPPEDEELSTADHPSFTGTQIPTPRDDAPVTLDEDHH